ncbi:MAG: hypothetical protein ACK559_20555, partial [bacterium]
MIRGPRPAEVARSSRAAAGGHECLRSGAHDRILGLIGGDISRTHAHGHRQRRIPARNARERQQGVALHPGQARPLERAGHDQARTVLLGPPEDLQ